MTSAKAGTSVCVVGAGIVGLAVARELLTRYPGIDVRVLDKESSVARHQTGHNSGVIHAGVYYRPGSLKAELCTEGSRRLRAFCAEHDIAIENCGKVVIARNESELARLDAIRQSAETNGVPRLEMLSAAGLADIEPNARGIRALHSPTTAIVDFAAVANALSLDVERGGGRVVLGEAVAGISQRHGRVTVSTRVRRDEFDRVILCAGLQSDRVAVLAGDDRDPLIIPFRGEYYRLASKSRALVRGLIYPVPDPRYPFLGVHFTRRIDGNVDIGPNAVMGLAREGYRRSQVSPFDVASVLRWPGFWRMARHNWRAGIHEVAGSLSKRAFLRQAQTYVPTLGPDDVRPAPAGIRAQAVDRSGALLDDFCIHTLGSVVAIRNAPSPAATSSLAIARHICDGIDFATN